MLLSIKKIVAGILVLGILIMIGFHIKGAMQTWGRGPFWKQENDREPTNLEVNLRRWEAEGISAYLKDVLGEDADAKEYLSVMEIYGDKYPVLVYGGDLTTVRYYDFENFEEEMAEWLKEKLPKESNVMWIREWVFKNWKERKLWREEK